ncbi:MAG: hypothetical protein WD035_07830 [Balneolaceae bacterium]
MKKILLITASVFILIYLALTLALYTYVTPERLSNLANGMLNDKLKVEIQSVTVQPLRRSFVLGDVRLTASDQELDVVLFSAGELSIRNIGILSALNGDVSIGRLTADHYFLDLTILPDQSTTSYSGRTSAPIYIGSFDLQNGELNFSAGTDGTANMTGVNATAGSFTYDPDLEEEPDLFTQFQDVEAAIERIAYRFKGDRYLLQADSLIVSEGRSAITLVDFSMATVLSEQEFFSSLDVREELFHIDISGLNINNIDFSSLRKNGDLKTETVSADSLNLHVTLNKRIPARTNPDTIPLPLQNMNNLPMTVALDSLIIRNGNILYSEYDEKGTRPGTIHFARTQATGLNINNISDDPVVFKARSYLEETGLLETEIRLFTDASGHVTTVTGSLGEFDLTRLNNIFMDLEGLEITEGRVYNLEFDYRMNELSSSGSVQIHYDRFNMKRVDRDDYHQNLGNRISGLFMNQIVMRSSSMDKNQEFRAGIVSAERDPEKGFFNYLWISLRSGLLDTVSRI